MKHSFINILSVSFMVVVTTLVFFNAGPGNGLNWWGDIFPYGQLISSILLMLVGIAFGCLFVQI